MRVNFFADESDLLSVLNTLESKRKLKYVLANSSTATETVQWARGTEIAGLGRADGEQTSACRSFLIMDKDTGIVRRSIRQYDKSARSDWDQLSNPDSIVFTPAGVWDERTMIAGSFGTAPSSPSSLALMRLVKATLKKHFTKIRAFGWGPRH